MAVLVSWAAACKRQRMPQAPPKLSAALTRKALDGAREAAGLQVQHFDCAQPVAHPAALACGWEGGRGGAATEMRGGSESG